jgi:hypothetical protein
MQIGNDLVVVSNHQAIHLLEHFLKKLYMTFGNVCKQPAIHIAFLDPKKNFILKFWNHLTYHGCAHHMRVCFCLCLTIYHEISTSLEIHDTHSVTYKEI